ncbi:MAG TPA: BsuBI/PstI family type II restriction endonuclease [Thermoanaerobaculia bacterium]|nr:BsuBI/PstI family type II restriction endonuclease [Thermoanaerobaculia bacterium]
MIENLLFGIPLPGVEEIHRRLNLIIPPQLDPRNWARRGTASKVVFVMLYGYAVEGFNRWIRPTAVTDMTDEQAALTYPEERVRWLDRVQGRKRPRDLRGRWYEENSREQIRDETIRSLVDLGIVIKRPGVATNSPAPQYALAKDFTDLFHPDITGEDLQKAIVSWRQKHLSPAELARLALARSGAGAKNENILVYLPSGETRRLAPGPSSLLTKAVVEEFASRFLNNPAVVMISESAKKMTFQDEQLARAIGLTIPVSKTLPDLILVDLDSNPPMLVFVECVATEGPISEQRRGELEALAVAAGYSPSDCSYVTAFEDRAAPTFTRIAASLAWGSFVWFKTEPDHIVFLREGGEGRSTTLSTLLRGPVSPAS